MEAIAPNLMTVRKVLWLCAGFVIAGALLTLLGFPERGGSPAAVRPLVYGVLMLVLGVLGSGYLWLWRRNSRLLVGVDQFGYQDALARGHVWSRGDVGRVVDLSVRDSEKSPARRMVYFLRPDGRRLLLLSPNAWSDDAIGRMVRATGRPLEIRQTPMTRAEFVATFPKATSWPGRHPNLFLIGIVAVPFAIAIAVTFINW